MKGCGMLHQVRWCVREGAGSRLVRTLLLTTALVDLCGAGHALADPQAQAANIADGSGQLTFVQTEGRPSVGVTTVQPQKTRRGVDTPVANTGATGLTEVVVTARKRAENLQIAPVSETAISGAEAEGLNVRNFQDLRGLVSNLEVTPQANGGAALTIRGVGQTSDQVNADAKTGFYVNEMYVGRQEGNSLYFYDVNSLQVLKGPQGTLFGKNTTGGAVLLSTALPTDQLGGYLQIRAGDYSRIDTEGAINIPLNDTLFARVSFRTDNADGFIKHVLDNGASDNIDDKSIRGQIRWRPTDRFTADVLFEYNKSTTNGVDEVITGCDNNQYAPTNFAAIYGQQYCNLYPILPQSTGHYQVYGGAALSIPQSSVITPLYTGGDYNGGLSRHGHRGPFNDTDASTVNIRLNYKLTDDIALKSITTYRRSQATFYNATDDAPVDIYAEYDSTPTNQVTQELNISGNAFSGRLNYVAGFFYYQQNTYFTQDTGPDFDGDPIGYLYTAKNKFTSYAGYIQASFKITPALELTLGGRYTLDHKSATSDVFNQTNYSGVCADTPVQAVNDPYGYVAPFIAGAAACGGDFIGSNAKSWNNFSPRAQLSYRLTPDIYVYGSVTSGYNAGGFNQQLGNDLGGTLLSYNPEKLVDYEGGLKTEFLDHRLRFNITGFYQKYSDIQTTVLVTYNHVLTRAIVTGATAHEDGIEAELAFTPVRDLLLTANVSLLQQHYDSVSQAVIDTGTTVSSPVDTAPKYTYALAGSYTFRFDRGYILTPSVNWRAVGDKPGCNPIGACYLPAYGLLGARVDFKLSQESPWTVAFWGTNLANADVVLNEISEATGGFGVAAFTPGRPREYGVEFTRTF
jgi:iron complex outermembrane receptor protein